MSHRVLAFTAQRLLHILRSFPAVNEYIAGFSGGADSTALLHALGRIQNQLDTPVSAVHVNHGLHDDADLWQSQCESFCRQNKIKLVCLKVKLENCSGKGVEAEARHLRYEAISTLLEPGACLLTAHHADDQAETLILNLMRGSGVDGLSAMPESRALGQGVLQRPLLGFQNKALRDYLRENNIEWTEDPSNLHLNHDRNFVRHEIIPLLENRWPEVSKRLLLTRKAMTDARYLLEGLADDYLDKNLAHAFVLQVTSQAFDHVELLKLVIRRWMKNTAAPTIPAYQLESFCAQLRQANSGHKVSIAWAGWILRLYKHQLWLQTNEEVLPCPTVKWPGDRSGVDLGSDIGQLVLHDNGNRSRGWPGPQGETGNRSRGWPGPQGETGNRSRGWPGPEGELCVGARINITDSVISQGGHHKNLKNLFQQADIPPWLRDCIPLCKLDDELVAVGDWCFSEQFAAWLSENDIKLSWRPCNPLLQFILTQQHQGSADVDPVSAVR